MSIPKMIFGLFLIRVFVLNAYAVEIEVGDRRIELPSPSGFVELTPEMSPYYEAMRAYIAPNNVRHLTLISKDKAEALLRGEAIEIDRYINVESEKSISVSSISSDQFSELRNIIRHQLDDTYENFEKQIQKMVDEGNEELSAEFSVDFAVGLGGMVPLPIHLDADSVLANSMYMTVGSTVDGEDVGSNVLAATTMFLHIKDKVLFLYVYGEESELAWTRETAATWAKDIVVANPLSSEEKKAIDRSTAPDIDWNQVLQKGLVGALVGGLIGLGSFLLRRRKKR